MLQRLSIALLYGMHVSVIASPLGSRKLKYVLPQGEEALLCILLSNTGILHCKQVDLLPPPPKELQPANRTDTH